ncbi:MAG TPA: G1 family glutamic endopeptidase [Gaiellaceae bacterium]
MAQVETEQQHAAQAIHDALGVRLFKKPPENFDPLQAEDRELLVFGYPARPDKDKHPELHEMWTRMASRKLTMIEPQFALRTDKQHGIRNTIANDTSTNWSGAVSFAGKGDSATYVIGQWTVPDVVAPGLGSYYCASWVGIDGDGSPDVLQAGTECDVVSFGFFTAKQTYVWWEWYPNYEVQIANFPVTSGDVMFCAICVHSDTEAGFYLTNLTTGASTSFTKTAPEGTRLTGNCAEWIVEAPTVNGGQSALARYGDVYFDECIAGTKNDHLLYGGDGDLITMVDSSNHPISVPTKETDELIKIQFV